MPITMDNPLTGEGIREMLTKKDHRYNKEHQNNSKKKDWGESHFFAYGVNKTCSTIDEALEAFHIGWEVEAIDIKSNTPDRPEVDGIEFCDHKGIIRKDNHCPLSVVGASVYTPIQNSECLKLIEDILQDGQIVIESGATFDYGRRVWVACRLPQEFTLNFKGGGKQTIVRYIHLSWSHDQTQAVTVSFMPYARDRKVSLASFAPNGVPTSISFKHTTFAHDRMKRGSEIMSKAMQFFQNAEEMLQQLANMTLTPDRFNDMLNYLYPEPEDKEFDSNGNKKESKESKTRNKIRDRWEKLPADLQFTDYGAFIAMAECADFDNRTAVRGSGDMSESEKEERQSEQRLDSSLYGSAQKQKQRAAKVIFNFDTIKNNGGITL